MLNSAMRSRMGFSRALFLGWAVACLLAMGLCLGFYLRESGQVEHTLRERETVRVLAFSRLFADDFKSVIADLEMLSANEDLNDYLNDRRPESLARFARNAQRLSQLVGVYDQVRFIDDRGQERVRVNLGEGIVPDGQLQNKADRSYFKTASGLKPGQIYLSPLDLNVENGRVELPLKPVMRFALPVFDREGNKRGVLVINLLGSHLLSRFEQIASAYKHRLRLLNAGGWWLRAQRPEMEWGAQLPAAAGFNLARTAPDLWKNVGTEMQGQLPYEGGLFSWQRVAPSQSITSHLQATTEPGDDFLVIASQFSAAEWHDAFIGLRQSFLVLGGVLLGIITIGVGVIGARQRTAARLRAADEMRSAIVRTANVAVITVNPDDGLITSFNNTAERWLGWSADELVGKLTPAVFHDKDEIAAHAKALSAEFGTEVAPEDAFTARVTRTGRPDEGEWTFIRKDGTRFPVWLSVNSLRNENGVITDFFGVASDFSDRKRAERALREAFEAAQESARLKSQFLANMSHEIRTPMNGVVGMTGLLLDTDLTTEQRGFAGTIRSSADALLNIINDILDFSKIEAGMLTFEKQPFDLREPVENCLALVSEKAHVKGLELAYLIEENVPTHLVGDSGRLHQVLLNLVGNAVKFTSEGEIVVRVAKLAEQDRRVSLRFSVSDTGMGISESAQKNLFQPFMQADGSMTRRFGGTGLGLAICRQLVSLMGGEIGIESTEGKGSTFWFTAVFPQQEASLKVIPARTDFAGMRALIVDDNATNREILERQLASWRVETASASGGEQALVLARTATDRPFGFAILDMQMPGMTGLDLARQLRAEPACAGLRMLILTSIGRTLTQEELAGAGVGACLIKPARQSLLHDTLIMLLGSGGSRRPLPSSLPVPPPSGPVSEVKPLRILLAEDNLVNQNVARMQLAKFGYKADLVGTGLAAVQAAQTQAYDIVLMDCQMPEMDGYEATRVLRQWEVKRRDEGEKFEPIFIIAMTANAMQGDRDACLAAGMDDYVSKPVRPQELAAAIARAPASHT